MKRSRAFPAVIASAAAALLATAACGGDQQPTLPTNRAANAVASARAAIDITITDLGPLQGGGHVVTASGINNSGTVVGGAYSIPGNRFVAFSKAPREIAIPLTATLTFESSSANYINERGDIVGVGTPPSTAVVWPAGDSMIEIPEMTIAHAINNRGVVVGASVQGGAGLWTQRDGFRALGGDVALDINEADDVVGQSAGRAAIWPRAGTLQLIPTTPASAPSTATGINNRGEVVGFIGPHFFSMGFVWNEQEGLTMLATPAGLYSHPEAINNKGEIAGWLTTGGSDGSGMAVMWTASGDLVQLGALVPGGKSQAFDINDRGEIAGVSSLADGGATGVLWTLRGHR